jgi:hypothetical protein
LMTEFSTLETKKSPQELVQKQVRKLFPIIEIEL